ncbi:MAG: isocitrate lyase/phosphoenolpyruvate mutase family protein [Chitinophagaceae bacterium]
MSTYETFLTLHRQDQPLLIGNVWDLTSAKAFEESGYKAIATSSVAVANSFGYEDKQHIPFQLLLDTVKTITKHIVIPLSVDMEAGYNDTVPGILENIEKIHDVGAVGFNIEDSVITEKGKMRTIEDFQHSVSSIRNHLDRKNMKMFINTRTDAYVHKLDSRLTETINRAKAYEQAGSSGIFVPFLDEENDAREIVKATTLPVSLFYTPTLPLFEEVGSWGIKRISMGGSIYRSMINSLKSTLQSIRQDQSFRSLGKK